MFDEKEELKQMKGDLEEVSKTYNAIKEILVLLLLLAVVMVVHSDKLGILK